jgi:hypothetical protein
MSSDTLTRIESAETQPEHLVFRVASRELGGDVRAVVTPVPSKTHELVRREVPAATAQGTADTDDAHSSLTPHPYLVVVETAGSTAALLLTADADWHRWTWMAVEADADAVTLRVDFEGETPTEEAAGHVRVALLVAEPRTPVFEMVRRVVHAAAPEAQAERARPDWWARPIYCGWGDQVATSLHMEGPGYERRCLPYCTQGLYERWVARLEEAELPFGITTIDAGWSRSGAWEPIDWLWPDLRGFIDREHEKGRKVLLWLGTWMTDGLPAEWCVRHPADGRPLMADANHPEYLAQVREWVERMLSPAPGGLDADGFKIDQLRYVPSRRWPTAPLRFGFVDYLDPVDAPLRMTPGAYGVELMRNLQKAIYDTAHAVKADALVTSSTLHPVFHDTFDMMRIHDTGRENRDVFSAMKQRADLSRAIFPAHAVDADDWVHGSYEQWLSYTSRAPAVGTPTIFYSERTVQDFKGEPTTMEIPLADLRAIGQAWREAGIG